MSAVSDLLEFLEVRGGVWSSLGEESTLELRRLIEAAWGQGAWSWLGSTMVLQRDYFGFDWEKTGRDAEAVAASLKDNSFAIGVELAEASVEYSWKHWAADEPFVNRDRVVEELVDVGHFLANMLLAVGVTDAEWEARYRAKQDKNRRRMRSGTYSAKKGALGEGSEVE